jgi:hypothetical protein
MNRLPLLVYLLSASCTYITVTAPDDAGQPFDTPVGADSLADTKTQPDAFYDVLGDTSPQTDTMTQADVTVQADALQQDAQRDTLPPPDAPCGTVGLTCCEGSQCLHWPALDHSYMCVAPAECIECGTANRPCCNYMPRCASWLLCILISDTGEHLCKS